MMWKIGILGRIMVNKKGNFIALTALSQLFAPFVMVLYSFPLCSALMHCNIYSSVLLVRYTLAP